MKLFLNITLILLTLFACYIEDIYLFFTPTQPGKTALITVRCNRSFDFDQEKALGGKRKVALSQYIPLYTYMPNNVESSRERMESLMQKASSLQPWKQSREQSLAKYLKKELDVELPLDVATQLLLYNNLKNLLEGILTIQESILQKKIVKNPEPFNGKKAIEILYPGPEGTVTHLA
ncbi:MAG: hypothetical protein GY857_01265, partial [Desulfobacula sp.]|nr:hypothetical protein [Desulfobacula sp.]